MSVSVAPSITVITPPEARTRDDGNNATKEPSSVGDMLHVVTKYNGGTAPNLREALRVIKEANGSHRKGDILVRSRDLALVKLKEMIQASCIPHRRDSKKRVKWEFRSSPHEHFGKTLDDTFFAFLKWAQIKGTKSYNISKAFRRLEAYAEWMEEAQVELDLPMTASSVQGAISSWAMKCSINQDDVFIWWTDLAQMDFPAVKKDPINGFRAIVWISHFAMYHPNAQEHGIQFCENLNRLGFMEALALLPSRLKSKIDKLTMGCLPIKITKVVMLECPLWMDMWIRFVFLFLSKKIKERFACHHTFASIDEMMGKSCIPKGFGQCSGTLERDLIEKIYGF